MTTAETSAPFESRLRDELMAATARPTLEQLIDRLRRRGRLTITSRGDHTEVLFDALFGPRTVDMADVFDRCRLGARSWAGKGDDLLELLATCEAASRPRTVSPDEIRVEVQSRRDTRTYGPPLPSYARGFHWRWQPGHDRWLRASSHATEYLNIYLHERERAREDEERWPTATPAREVATGG